MVRPVAARLRQLLDEAPARAASHSLLITGHSAGGAVAALLYCHMLATSRGARSELGALTGRFRCVHCVTFGAPPVSLLPLAKPGAGGGEAPRARDLRKSLFLSFVNEGDPVARADKAYVRSLLELFAAPAPAAKKVSSRTARAMAAGPVWRVPRGALSNAGRIVVLRSADARTRWLRGRTTVAERLDEGVVAQVVTDEQLRGVVWGDPVAHVMALYARRIEDLAVAAVTAKGY